MKALLTLVLFFVACTPTKTPNPNNVGMDTEMSTIYKISCEGPKGWVEYSTFSHPYKKVYGFHTHLWEIPVIGGGMVYASNCVAEVTE